MDIIGIEGIGVDARLNFNAGQRPASISGHAFYADKYWQPQAYWAWQDTHWMDPRSGEVTVLPLRDILDADSQPAD